VGTGLSRNMSFHIGAAPTHTVGARRSLADKGGIVSEGGLHDEQFASIKHGMVIKPPGARAHEQLALVWSSQVDSRNDGLGARGLGQMCAYHASHSHVGRNWRAGAAWRQKQRQSHPHWEPTSI
jgi:hypothetical protein